MTNSRTELSRAAAVKAMDAGWIANLYQVNMYYMRSVVLSNEFTHATEAIVTITNQADNASIQDLEKKPELAAAIQVGGCGSLLTVAGLNRVASSL